MTPSSAPEKPPTRAQLLRKIERLKAIIADMQRIEDLRNKSLYGLISDKVDYEFRVKHAIEILNGGEV